MLAVEMTFWEPHTKEFLRHVVQNFLVVLVFTVVAIAFDWLEHFLAAHGISEWLVVCTGVVAKITYAFDATLFLAILGMTGAHFLRNFYTYLFRR